MEENTEIKHLKDTIKKMQAAIVRLERQSRLNKNKLYRLENQITSLSHEIRRLRRG